MRADLDALAMADETTVPYRSQIPGVAHACGHDVHTTIVLGAGLALAHLLAEEGAPDGRVRLLFEPAEESARGGALDVINAGGLEDVDWLFGLHCDPKLDAGQLGVRAGAITSAADLVTIHLHGPGGHTARPAPHGRPRRGRGPARRRAARPAGGHRPVAQPGLRRPARRRRAQRDPVDRDAPRHAAHSRPRRVGRSARARSRPR